MSLTKLISAAKNDLPVTMRHERWLVRNSQARYSAEAVAFAKQALLHEVGGQRDRISSFRSSGLGQCHRRQIFRYFKLPEEDPGDSGLSNIFHTGNYLHLKWQMAGITEGWLTQAEVPKMNLDLRFGGTLDGILFDGSGFEFKSINSRGYSNVMYYGPKELHVLQVHAYMLLDPSITAFSIVYENKDTGEWREYRVTREAKHLQAVQDELDQLNNYLDDGRLPAQWAECARQEGRVYRQCPYRTMCATATFPSA